TRNLGTERTAFAWRVALYAVFAGLLVVVNLVTDHTRIRIGVEDRRSVLSGLAAAWRFIWRHPGHVFMLYLLNGAVFLVVLAIWLLIAPHAGAAGVWRWGAFVLDRKSVV